MHALHVTPRLHKSTVKYTVKHAWRQIDKGQRQSNRYRRSHRHIYRHRYRYKCEHRYRHTFGYRCRHRYEHRLQLTIHVVVVVLFRFLEGRLGWLIWTWSVVISFLFFCLISLFLFFILLPTPLLHIFPILYRSPTVHSFVQSILRGRISQFNLLMCTSSDSFPWIVSWGTNQLSRWFHESEIWKIHVQSNHHLSSELKLLIPLVSIHSNMISLPTW